MRKTVSKKKTCLSCTNEYVEKNFYAHRNKLINENFGVCKKCAKSFVQLSDLETLSVFLRTLDLPYKKKYWLQANESEFETLGTYIKNVNSLQQLKELTFKDSDELTGNSNISEVTMISKDFKVEEHMFDRWGRNFKEHEVIQLETLFTRYGGYDCEGDIIQTTLIENISKTQFSANMALSKGDTQTYEKMIRVLSMLMNDANMKPIQVKSTNDDKGSLGEWVKFLEQTAPIDILHKEFKDEKFIKYIYKFFVVQIKRIFGKASDKEVEEMNSVMKND